MPRGTWSFGYNLEATNKCATTTPAKVAISVKDKITFALSGGGSRGDFQLGALRYLADKGIKPNTLTTTSVGSINGLQLAHGDQVAGTAQSTLENIWFTKMNTCKDMFDLSAVSLAIRTAIENALPNAVGSAAAGAGIGGGVGLVLLGPVGLIIGLLSGSIGGGAAGVQQAINNVLPLIDVIMTDGPDAMIGGVTMERSGMYTFAPLRATMVAQVMPNQVATSGIELRMMAVALDDGALVAVDEKGKVWKAARGQRLQKNGESATLVEGAMASSAMPSLIPHEKVGSLTCVDGGVREVIPVATAIDDLGASTVYAIMCSAGVSPRTKAAEMSMLSVFGRAVMEIPFTEINDDDAMPHGGWPADVDVFIIRPTFNVHDAMVIEPGLIRIAFDYGWIRAADVLDGPPGNEAGARVACDRIIRARTQAWQLEHHIYGQAYKDPRPRPVQSSARRGHGRTPEGSGLDDGRRRGRACAQDRGPRRVARSPRAPGQDLADGSGLGLGLGGPRSAAAGPVARLHATGMDTAGLVAVVEPHDANGCDAGGSGSAPVRLRTPRLPSPITTSPARITE